MLRGFRLATIDSGRRSSRKPPALVSQTRARGIRAALLIFSERQLREVFLVDLRATGPLSSTHAFASAGLAACGGVWVSRP